MKSKRILYFDARMRKFLKILTLSVLINTFNSEVCSQNGVTDTIYIDKFPEEKYTQFYDSLKHKANKNRVTRFFYDFLISPPRQNNKKEIAMDYFSAMEGKTISDIDITALDVFGPTLDDTTTKAKSWAERMANDMHSKSNLKTIKRMLMFDKGDVVDAEKLYENERIIRTLAYIKDVRFFLEQDPGDPDMVKVHVITKDRFSLGVSGNVNGINSAAIEVYNQNIFGVGHEVSLNFVGHINKEPNMGLETFYSINNIRGKFIDLEAGYMNTYRKEGFSFTVEKPFLTPSMKWGYGASAQRMYRTDRISDKDKPIETEDPLSFSYYSSWAARSFQINQNKHNNSQVVISAGLNNHTYHRRPDASLYENHLFTNNTLYLAGLTFSQRRFIQDQLVYSYGIVEDIPEGFKNEIVYGFDANEFGNRHYLHLYSSNGNLLSKKSGYLYLSAGIGTYFNKSRIEQGLLQTSLSFISRQIDSGDKRARLFVKSNYMLGFRRFDIENLDLSRNEDIRGFSSTNAVGKQKLSMNFEFVRFLKKEFYKFSMALYGFADLGIIGSNKHFIFNENYYGGIGFGMRFHNENLVFKTIRLRLVFYPYHPKDMSFVGTILDEQSKQKFYSFEPTAPEPLSFE